MKTLLFALAATSVLAGCASSGAYVNDSYGARNYNGGSYIGSYGSAVYFNYDNSKARNVPRHFQDQPSSSARANTSPATTTVSANRPDDGAFTR